MVSDSIAKIARFVRLNQHVSTIGTTCLVKNLL
jgi:hypothetical protein